MKNVLIFLSLIFTASTSATAAKPDTIVTSDGETIKVYNLDVTSGDKIYYTLTEDADALFNRIAKADVLIIKLADGTKLDPSASVPMATQTHVAHAPVNPNAHEPVTHRALTDFITDKKGRRTIHVGDGNGQVLNMRLLLNEDKTLAVTKWDGKGKYNFKECVIPEYVDIDGDIYTVQHIDYEAFRDAFVVEIQFPSTLREIEPYAFYSCRGITQIVLPEEVKKIGAGAFLGSGGKPFKQLYIPTKVRDIGNGAFNSVGPKHSYNGYFQGNLTSIPDWITTGNCTQYGIDEEAVEAYEKRQAAK